MKAMDCAACFIAKLEKKESKGGQYGSPEHTQILKSCRKSNNVDATEAHEDAAFCLHATGILKKITTLTIF